MHARLALHRRDLRSSVPSITILGPVFLTNDAAFGQYPAFNSKNAISTDFRPELQEGAPILNQSRQESPEPSVLKLCNFWRLLVVGGVPGPATRPFHLLRQPPSVLADGRKLGDSRKGPFGVWGCSRPPEMLRTPGFLHLVARKMY